ncbi:MAG: sigma-54 dependent transcriptional regulator [Pirellulaceae bacterium]|nr:sigma-54 dependent transcriptional regulator [Pirellulaceae bacterium]MDP7019248.1 sigma-54 dependent transcriptional regulator [Pirellulaceae bacterium]
MTASEEIVEDWRVDSPPLLAAHGASMGRLMDQARRVSQNELTTLITGESGTGKTTIAKWIHCLGPRAAHPFVTVNCASLPRDLIEAELFGHAQGAFTGAVADRPGRVEAADGGTLLLDEIGDMPIELQPKLLTFLQDQSFQRIGSDRRHRVNVRVIAATNQNLAEHCQAKSFREDLYFRLNVLALRVPPLRERRDLLAELAHQIILGISARAEEPPPRIEEEAMFALMRHPWPGNVRELENVLERACVFRRGNVISAADLAFDVFPPPADEQDNSASRSLAGRTMADIERQALVDTLEACRGNKAMASRQLGISERSIYNKLKRYQLSY